MKFFQTLVNIKNKSVPMIESFFIEHYRIFNKPTLFLMILFGTALFPLFRADVNYIDDSMRALNGGRDWAYLHSRWTSEYLSVLVHADYKLRDIAPLTQILAIFLISLASVIFCWIVCEKKLTKAGILISALLGLSPFYLECFAFKFDSPYMALSVLASIFPFIFAFKNKKIFATISFFSLLVMLTTYQLSGGIYIMIVIFLLFQSWNAKSHTLEELRNFFLISTGSYIAALTFFRIFLLKTQIFQYNTIFSFSEMLPGVLDNIQKNFEKIIGSFNVFWIWILAIMIILFAIKSIIVSKQNKFASLALSLLTLILLFFFFQGFFIFVDNVGSVPRYLSGFNTFIVLIALYLAKPPYKIFSIPAFVLLYCFFVFSFAFGNALEYQKDYKIFYATMLINDLSKIIVDEKDLIENSKIYFMDPIGNSPGVKSLQRDYPIIRNLVPNDFGKHVFGYTNLAWYNFPATQTEAISRQQKKQAENFPVLVDSYYYTIRSENGKDFYIWFNNQ